jgi:hypothetical protein
LQNAHLVRCQQIRALKAEKLKAIEPKVEIIPVASPSNELPLMKELDFPIEEMKIEFDFAS